MRGPTFGTFDSGDVGREVRFCTPVEFGMGLLNLIVDIEPLVRLSAFERVLCRLEIVVEVSNKMLRRLIFCESKPHSR